MFFMAFEQFLAALNSVLAALVLIYLAFYFYLWKMRPGGDFHVLKNPYFTLIAIGLFAISNLLTVMYVFAPGSSLDFSLLLSAVGMALFFIAIYLKIKRNAYEQFEKHKKKKR